MAVFSEQEGRSTQEPGIGQFFHDSLWRPFLTRSRRWFIPAIKEMTVRNRESAQTVIDSAIHHWVR